MDHFGIKSSWFLELLWFLERIASWIEARAFAKPSSSTSKLVFFCMQKKSVSFFFLRKVDTDNSVMYYIYVHLGGLTPKLCA